MQPFLNCTMQHFPNCAAKVRQSSETPKYKSVRTKGASVHAVF